MSEDFTYSPPDEMEYLKAVLLVLRQEGHNDLHDLLKYAKCSINASNRFSRRRWNGMYTTVTFQIPMLEYEKLNATDEDHELLRRISDRIMPSDAGLDVMQVSFAPLLVGAPDARSLEQDLEQIQRSLSTAAAEFTLPSDLLNKGQQMAEVYLYLYSVENYLRLFIETVGNRSFGSDYLQQFNVPSSVRQAIKSRKEQEAKNQWISIRGNSDLFYLDFKELGTLVLNNWELFKAYFPDQSWLSSKIDELGNCRNLVAHNSYLGEHERDVIRVNFRSIVRQLNPYMK